MTFNSIKSDVDKIHHLCGEVQGRWLFDLIRGLKVSGDICEIGAFYGYITAVMAHACHGSDRRVLSVDHMVGGQCDFPEGSKCVYADYMDNLVRRGLWDKVLPFPIKTEILMEIFGVMQPRIALLYLDGNHNEEPVFDQLTQLSPFVPVGGLICGDDCMAKSGMRDFNEMWREGRDAFYFQGVSQAVWRFFHGNDKFRPLAGVPGNQFGFRRVV